MKEEILQKHFNKIPEGSTVQMLFDDLKNDHHELFEAVLAAMQEYADQEKGIRVPAGWTAFFTDEKSYIDFLKWQREKESSDSVPVKPCTHEGLIDTGVGYYHCHACNGGWTYVEWENINGVPVQEEDVIELGDLKEMANEYYKKLTAQSPKKGIGSAEYIYFMYGLEFAFNRLFHKAAKGAGEDYVPGSSNPDPEPIASHSCTEGNAIGYKSILYEVKELIDCHYYAAKNDNDYPMKCDKEEISIAIKKLQSVLNRITNP